MTGLYKITVSSFMQELLSFCAQQGLWTILSNRSLIRRGRRSVVGRVRAGTAAIWLLWRQAATMAASDVVAASLVKAREGGGGGGGGVDGSQGKRTPSSVAERCLGWRPTGGPVVSERPVCVPCSLCVCVRYCIFQLGVNTPTCTYLQSSQKRTQ